MHRKYVAGAPRQLHNQPSHQSTVKKRKLVEASMKTKPSCLFCEKLSAMASRSKTLRLRDQPLTRMEGLL